MPVATGDVPYLRHEQATRNEAVCRAAAAAGATYVDLNGRLHRRTVKGTFGLVTDSPAVAE